MTLTPAEILTAAFTDDPWITYLAPDTHQRERWLPWFMRASVRLAERGGVLDRERDAVGLWFPPDSHAFGWPNVVRSGMVALPARLGLAATRRFQRAERDLEDALAGLEVGPAWYLYMIAVHPDAQGQGLARALLERGLARADAEHTAVRLETNLERNVTLYERFGFELAARCDTPGVLPQWVMVRPAR